MSNSIAQAEIEQDKVLNILTGIEGVSVGISWKKGIGFYLKINADKDVKRQVEKKLDGLDFPVQIEPSREVSFD